MTAKTRKIINFLSSHAGVTARYLDRDDLIEVTCSAVGPDGEVTRHTETIEPKWRAATSYLGY